MYAHVHGNLNRQFKALELLEQLLDEEFAILQARDTDAVTAIEFSIHELLRQIAEERMGLKDTMQNTKVLEYASMLPDDQAADVTRLYHLIDAAEQRCSRQASRNTELSLALMDQSQALLAYLHEQICPRPAGGYSSKGRMQAPRPEAALITGRL